jgi:two-component system cell cycle response regulator DivK
MTKTILVVEDNELNMRLFCDLLEVNGYRAVTAATGAEALAQARAERPDVILMDVQLPDMSGMDVTAAIKNDPELNHIAVIAVTAFAMKGDEERFRAGGCEAYISKPITVSRFLETVRQFA